LKSLASVNTVEAFCANHSRKANKPPKVIRIAIGALLESHADIAITNCLRQLEVRLWASQIHDRGRSTIGFNGLFRGELEHNSRAWIRPRKARSEPVEGRIGNISKRSKMDRESVI